MEMLIRIFIVLNHTF